MSPLCNDAARRPDKLTTQHMVHTQIVALFQDMRGQYHQRERRCETAREGSGYSLCGAEGGVEDLLAVQVVDVLHLVQVERVLSGDGAVEPGLEEGGPHAAPVTGVGLTHPADPRDHTLTGDEGAVR